MEKMFSIEAFLDKIYEAWPKLLLAVILFIIGTLVSKLVIKFIRKSLKRSKIEATYHSFFISLIKIGLNIVVLFIALTTLGVPSASLVTILGAASLAISLAIKDSLANLAGGFLILLSKPFTVGDYIESGGAAGIVKEITVLHTRLNTSDNKVVYIPNGQMAGAKITNYSKEELRKLEIVFSLSCDHDILDTKILLQRIIDQNPLALKEPEPVVRVL
ncbi:MAG: Small-conductance mechanosensitive channel, partial [Oscillospiraceae bacterium]|nr:Small-conductance mechanosensitive channel [Oscillospiraceae bacterium]